MVRAIIGIIALIFLILLVASIVGCRIKSNKNVVKTSGNTITNYDIKYIDDCQYIERDLGIGESSTYSLCHKGDCNNPIHLCSCQEKANQKENNSY